MKKRLFAILLTVCMVISMAPAALAVGTNPFTDVSSDDWYYDEVQYVYENDLMKGTSTTTFSPDVTVNRAMMVTILYRLEGAPAVSTSGSFTDVPAGQYYTDAVEWAKEAKITGGYGNGLFGPNDLLTREQMATFFYRYAEFKGYDVSAGADLSSYADIGSVSTYALDAFKWTNANGLIKGTTATTLSPKGDATRGQLAVILYRFCENVVADAVEEHTVTFDYNYSDKGTYKAVTVEDGKTVDKPANPSRSGYRFKGWYTKATGGEKFDFNTEIAQDITLYAQWTKTSSGGSSSGGSSHSHTYSDVWSYDAVNHWNAATCGHSVKKNEAAHTTDANGLCSVCDVYVVSTDAQLAAALTSADSKVHVVLLNDINLPITSLGQQTGGSGEYKLGGDDTTAITIDLNGKNLNITTTYWSAIGCKNADATITVKNGSMVSTGNSATTWNANDLRFSNCNWAFENVVFKKEVALDNVGKSTTMKNVTINGTGDYYALWVTSEGQNVTIDGLTVSTTGRGIKIDNQYIAPSEKVTLNVSNAEFATAKKAAIVVKSPAGADITLSHMNISRVTADTTNAVWVDEDSAAYYNLVTVTGGTKILEGTSVIDTADELVDAFANMAAGDVLTLGADIDMTEKTLNATKGNVGFTLYGNGYTISNLAGTEQGLFVNNTGSSKYYFYDVNLKDCSVTSTTNYAALFVGDADTCDELVIEGCSVTNCTVKSEKYAAAFVAYTAGYNVQNNGPVYSDVTIEDCSVTGGTITGGGSVGAAIGHAGGNADTTNTIKNLTVSGTVINGKDAEHTGIAVGTANVGKTFINDVTYSGVTGNYNTEHNLYGRFVPQSTGVLSVDDVLVIAEGAAVDKGSNTSYQTLDAAIQAGATNIVLGSGTYIIPDSAQGKTLTIVGNGKTVVATQDDGSYEGCDYSLDGATVTFEGVTINTDSSTYTGYARLNATYKNCTINGTYTLYGNSEFTGCKFNVSGDVYNIWTWGAPNATFTNCTFNSDGKALLLYGTENTKLTVNDCVFNDKGGLTDLKAAIEIGNDYGKSYELIVNDTTVNGYEINDKGIDTGTTLWANKNSMGTDKLNVVVDGVDVY